ncbi:MAG: MFS transporter [Cyclonatronaceae bacterium]
MTYFEFIRSNKRLSAFGPVLTFHSAFGQTFFISLFVPFFLAEFDLTNTTFGFLYSGATLASALLIMMTGQLIDRYDLKWYSSAVAIGLGLSALLMSVAFSAWILIPGLVGLRFFGQGLTFHTAQSTMARYFDTLRGKALSVSALGLPFGEATLPSLFAFIIGMAGWRGSWLIIAVSAFILFLPALLLLLRPMETRPDRVVSQIAGTGDDDIIWKRRHVLRDVRFYFFLPAILLTPFMLTGLFLFQISLAEYKSWSVETIAAAFIAFASLKVIFSLWVGPAIDKYSAKKIFPWFILPFLLGILSLWLIDHPAAAFIYLGLLGVTEGLGMSVKTSLWAELYGIKTIGAIRSMLTTFMVISTAVSPLLFGWLIDSGYGFDFILPSSVVLTIAVILLAFGVNKKPAR